jgi:hypothetical protein
LIVLESMLPCCAGFAVAARMNPPVPASTD